MGAIRCGELRLRAHDDDRHLPAVSTDLMHPRPLVCFHRSGNYYPLLPRMINRPRGLPWFPLGWRMISVIATRHPETERVGCPPSTAGGAVRLPGRGRSLGGGLRGAFGGLCRRAVGWAPGAGQRTLDAGYALRYGVQVAAHVRHVGAHSVRVAVKASTTASMRCSRRRLCSTTTGTSFAVALAGIGNRPAGPDLKPESCSDFPLRTVEGNKTNLLCSWRDVERRGDVPQIRTPQVARLQSSRRVELARTRPRGVSPRRGVPARSRIRSRGGPVATKGSRQSTSCPVTGRGAVGGQWWRGEGLGVLARGLAPLAPRPGLTSTRRGRQSSAPADQSHRRAVRISRLPDGGQLTDTGPPGGG